MDIPVIRNRIEYEALSPLAVLFVHAKLSNVRPLYRRQLRECPGPISVCFKLTFCPGRHLPLEYKDKECGSMDESTTPTSTLSPGTSKHPRKDFRSSFQADLIKHVIFHDDNILWDRFLQPFPWQDTPDAPSGENDNIRMIADTLRESSDLNDIQAVQDATSDNEKAMMGPLDRLFRAIEDEAAKYYTDREHFRAFIRRDSTLVSLTNPPFGSLSVVKPDFVLVDLPRPTNGTIVNLTDHRGRVDWRHCPAFVEVKAKSEYLPNVIGEICKNTLTQGGDYARLLMAGRPFLVSTYALFICGNKFCIALCDRSGMVFAPAKRLSSAPDAIEDLECFIRVVLRFIWDMSLDDLGEDPTTFLAKGHTRYQDKYPHHDVSMGRSPGFETTHWTTVGEPLWVSHSLLGRGTSVWRALDRDHTPLILKVSWRTKGRPSETEIHRILRSFLQKSGIEEPKGLALASTGGDVYDNSGKIMSVSNRRGPPSSKYMPTIDRVLHRVCLTRFGKPIWEYSSLQEFARAMRDAIQAHDVLSGYGILHRDISAGNILIDVDASYKPAMAPEFEGIISKDRPVQDASGFLSDWEFAWFPQDVLKVAASHADLGPGPRVEHDLSMKVMPGDVMTGTAIFFATEVLFGLSDKRQVVRSRVHDLESFEWVIIYSIYAHSIKAAFEDSKVPKDKATKLMEEFQNIFAAIDPPELADKRANVLRLPRSADGNYFEKIEQLLSFVDLWECKWRLMDIWLDLIYRCQAVVSQPMGPPAYPGGFYQNITPPVAIQPAKFMEHKDLIDRLGMLIPSP